MTDSYCCVGKLLSPDKELWLWPSSLCIILFLIPALSRDTEGPQWPITMSDGVEGMASEEEDAGDGMLIGYLHHIKPH